MQRQVFGYVRVSTNQQEVERQERSLPERHRSLPDGLADHPFELFYDHGISAWSGKPRPGFEDMLTRIQHGEAAALVIDTSSRLTRQGIRAAITLLWQLEDANCRLFTTQGREYATDAHGLISLVIDAEQDERYSSTLSHNISTGKAAKVKAGRPHHGQLPPGYRRTEDGQLEATDDLFVIAELYQLFLAGRTFEQLCRHANDHLSAEYLATLKNGAERDRIRAWLRSPYYVGRLPHKGETHPGDHPAAVIEEVWDAAQVKLDANRAKNASRAPRSWPFSGIAKCRCGHALRLHPTQGGKFVYLRCSKRCPDSRDHPISAVFEANVMVGLTGLAFALTGLLAEDESFGVPTSSKDDALGAARARLAGIEEETERVRDIILATGGKADDPRIVHLAEQREAASDEVARLARSTADYRNELHSLARSIFSLRFNTPKCIWDTVSRDWTLADEWTPLHPADMAEAVLLGWQYAPFEARLDLIREALTSVTYKGDSMEFRFRPALPSSITTSAALDPERSPIVRALDEEGWGRSAYRNQQFGVTRAGCSPRVHRPTAVLAPLHARIADEARSQLQVIAWGVIDPRIAEAVKRSAAERTR